MELSPLRQRLADLAQVEQGTIFEDHLNELISDLLAILTVAAALPSSATVFESILATHFAIGVLQAAKQTPPAAGKVLGPEKAYDLVRRSGALNGAVNTLAETKHTIAVRAEALSKVIKGQIIQDVRDTLLQVEGQSVEQAQAQVADAAKAMADLTINSHIRSHVQTQQQLAQGYGTFSTQQTLNGLRVSPYQEFYRAEHRVEWRDWPTRWKERGGSFYPGPSDYLEGRMIALADSRIWEDLSNPDLYSDATGSPYPPFAFNSGMGVKAVSVAEAKKLGLGGVRAPKPKKLSFNAGIRFSADLDDDIKSHLFDSMQDWKENQGELINEKA